VFVLLRNHTGHDFSQYKGSTIHRRIERRRIIHQLETMKAYVHFLEDHPAELDVLCRELLIRVTSFFRDPDAFAALGKALPDLLASRPDDHVIRAWVPGCCTGEEAYSIAMLLCECRDLLQRRSSVQIFATDLDPEALHVARAGVYPLSIMEDVSPGRLERFFVREGETFRVKQEVRDMLVFAPQNLIDDPPFTRLDLLSCRNLLIYLEAGLKTRLFAIFHHALIPGGLLFLGSSESIGGSGNLFTAIDKKWRVFQRREGAEGSYLAGFPAASSGPSVSGARPGNARIARAHLTLTSSAAPAPGPQSVASIFHMTHEELQSVNEELETSKEEMRSLNEELQAVNAELEARVEELSLANDDMQNLLDATGNATVFLDDELIIKRYTEPAERVIRLIPSDVGRPIGDLVSRIQYDWLVEDAQEVLRTLALKETKIRADKNTWYLMRILPYRTAENVIEGLVITFVDITRIKTLQESERRLVQALENSPTTVFGQNRELRYQWTWRSAFGHSFTELAGKTDEDLFAPDEAERLTELKRRVLDSGSGAREQMTLTVNDRARRYDLYVEPMRDDSGDIIGISGVVTDIT
jgi:two-component system CheB/CheR fusion protein